jgi:transcriptional regulator with XRE-family HTH domain
VTEIPLKDQRLAVGLTRQQLAEKARCSITFIQMLEGGFRPVQSRVLPRVVAVLTAYEDVAPPDNGRDGKDGDDDPIAGNGT